jgi:hypothetical protein
MILADTLGAAYKAIGCRFHTYPAHPTLIRSFARSQNWRLEKKAGTFTPVLTGPNSSMKGAFGGRPCAVFEYRGSASADVAAARNMLSVE